MTAPSLFTDISIPEAPIGGFKTTSAGPVVSHAFNVCTGLLVISKNHAGVTEATLFHLTSGQISGEVQAKLKEINRHPGVKAGVFIITTQSAGAPSRNVDADYFTGLLKSLIKDIRMAPVIKCPHTGMSVAFTPEDGKVHVWNYATKQTSSSVPFGPETMAAIGIGGRKKE